MNKEYIKCVVAGKSITACQRLSESLEYGNPTGTSKGIFIPERVNIKTGEPGTDIVQIHSGCFRKNGIAANFCPFCGESLVTWQEE